MFNYHEILETNPLFQGQTYSKRDAFRWIILNSKDNKAFVSISLLSSKWNWHSSKVKRFLNRLQEEKLITKAIKSGKLCLNLVAQDRTENRPAQTITGYDLQTNRRPISDQKRTNNLTNHTERTNYRPTQAQAEISLEEYVGPKANYESDQEEEKKKRSKKRKEEEFIKERNIPYGDTKKEKMLSDSFENSHLENSIPLSPELLCTSKVPVHLVEAKDVKEWAADNLQIDLDLNWELGKFQDYWLTSRKKPPKDGVAAFRNWLRKAMEIKTNNQGDRYDRFNNNKQKTSDFQRFLIGGAGALDELRRDRLDRNGSW